MTVWYKGVGFMVDKHGSLGPCMIVMYNSVYPIDGFAFSMTS